MAGWIARKLSRRCNFKRRSASVSIVVDEFYLRDDIACGSPLCSSCVPQLPRLPLDASHYLIPNADAILHFWEIMELPQFTAVIFLTSVLKEVQARSTQRGWRRLRSIFTDRRRCNVVFDDQHCVFTSLEFSRSSRDYVKDVAEWFFDHIEGQSPVVFLIGFDRAIVFASFGEHSKNFKEIDVDVYFKTYWQHDPSVIELFGSLALAYAESLQAKCQADVVEEKSLKGGRASYKEYLSATSIDTGIANGSLRVGVFTVNRDATKEAFVRPSNKGEASRLEILIPGRAMQNRALHGDTVAVRVTFDVLNERKSVQDNDPGSTTAFDNENEDLFYSNETPFTGEVVGILQRLQKDYVACLTEEDEATLASSLRQERLLCIPMDRRIPMVELRTRQGLRLCKQRLVIRIDNWEPDSKYPRGHLVRPLGAIGDLNAEMMAILVENGIPAAPFSSLSLQELPEDTLDRPWSIPVKEYSSRRDIRFSHRSCSIDPPGSKDVDDVLSVCELGNGLVEVGVHIADVSFFVKHGSLLDLEARTRGTTVYMVGKSWHMLPAVLSENLCSLLGGKDRLAVSVIWTLDLAKNFEVVDIWFGRTVIRSRHQFSYAQAEAILEGNYSQPGRKIISDDPAEIGRLRKDLTILAALARSRRTGRKLSGALELASTELKFEVNENKEPVQVETKTELPMNWIVAEMMIFANACVAEKIYRTFQSCALLRKHAPPKFDSFTMLLQCCEARGFVLDVSSNKALAASLDRMQESGDPVLERAFRALITRAMSEAEYFSTGNNLEFYHYGLALEYYTHFTSPIRRYADILVHRMLIASCELSSKLEGIELMKPSTQPVVGPHELQEIAEHLNERHRASKRAQKECNQLYLLMYLEKQSKAERGVVISITSKGFMVFVPKYDLRGPVYLEDKDRRIIFPVVDPPNTSGETNQEYALVKQATSIKIIKNASGKNVAEYKLMDTVWVQLRADGSRAHGPTLRMDLLSNTHPAVLAAQAEEISQSMSDMDLFSSEAELKRVVASSKRDKAIEAMVKMVAAEKASENTPPKQKQKQKLTVLDVLENIMQAKSPSLYEDGNDGSSFAETLESLQPCKLAASTPGRGDIWAPILATETRSQQLLRKKWQESLALVSGMKARLTTSTSANESERQQARAKKVAEAWNIADAERTMLRSSQEACI